MQNANLVDAFGIGRIDTDPEPFIIADNLAVLESASGEAEAIQAPCLPCGCIYPNHQAKIYMLIICWFLKPRVLDQI